MRLDPGLGTWNCSDTGTLTMANGATVGYAAHSCNPGKTTELAAGGATCLLCVLDATAPPARTVSAKTDVLSLSNPLTTYGGNDDINGSISNGTSLTALSCTSFTQRHPAVGRHPGEIRRPVRRYLCLPLA